MVLGDRWIVAFAVLSAAGAWLAVPVPVPVAPALAAVAVRRRWPAMMAVALLAGCATLSTRAWAGLDPAVAGAVRGHAVLVGDPERMVAGTRAVARLDGQRVELWAYGAPAGNLRRALAGDIVELSGQRSPRERSAIAADPWRRVVGRVQVATVHDVRPGAWPYRLANEVHRRLDRGASSLPIDDRALLAGLVLGDDRNQPPALRDAFAATGLSHLLAVSGQNVAFVLTAASPLLLRLRSRARFVAVLVLLAFFATVTRFEPSVLRAVAMAGLAATATVLGRPASGLRVLALAVIGLLVVDPLLVRALGFQLSVLASGGILVLAPPLARRLPLPSVVATAVAVPLAAQLATAPLLATRAGGLPLVSLPANVLAGPAAGVVMTWGSSVGVIAGYLPAPVAVVLGLPNRVLLWWIATVAVVAARRAELVVPVAALWAGAAAAGALGLVGRRQARAPTPNGPDAPPAAEPGAAAASGRRSWAVVLATTLLVAVLDGSPPPLAELPTGAEVYRHGADEVLVLSRPLDGARLLRSLRGRVEGPLDAMVVTSPSPGAWRAAEAVLTARRPPFVLGPPGRSAAAVAAPGDVYAIGELRLAVVPADADAAAAFAVEVRGAATVEPP